MIGSDRRGLIKGTAAGLAGLFGSGIGAQAAAAGDAMREWRRGLDNQRRADLGDGRFLNPVLSGDRPDPAILKDGDDYYVTFSTFDSYPGLLIWHSRDLVNWQPRKPALARNIGSVWAPGLHKDRGRYLLYIPVKAEPNDIFVSVPVVVVAKA